MAVRFEPQGFDFRNTLNTLAVQLVVKGQYGLLKPMVHGRDWLLVLGCWLLVKLDGMAAAYREIQPGARLGRYVECYWSQSHDEARDYVVLPDGCVDILFTRIGEQPMGLATVGLMTSPLKAASAAGQSFFGVRFRPGMASAFIPGAELLTDETRPLEDVAGSGVARQLLDQLTESNNGEDMARVMDGWLRPQDPPDIGERVLWQLESTADSLDQTIAQSGLSGRHFRRLCLERAGVSPKYLSRILRFRRAVQKMSAMRGLGQPGWADFAVACGYYDQAHLIREFQEFAGCTPGRFLQSPGRVVD